MGHLLSDFHEGRPLYLDRRDAGRALAARLRVYGDRDDVAVLALPRGGVPIAYEVATALDAPLDVFVVRKLGVPGNEEVAMGALAADGAIELNHDLVDRLGLTVTSIMPVVRRELEELARREQVYRQNRPPLDVRGRLCILVDDGLATGATMRAALTGLRQREPRRVVAAVPIASSAACAQLSALADEVVCAATPEPFWAVGAWYASYPAVSDEEVRALLVRADRERAS